jgi:GPH family glycoside/pentoside/hexuronide:cation symporter
MGAPQSAAEQTLPFRIAFGWGLGSLGVAVLFNATNVLLLRFLTDYAGLAAVAAGLAIALSKIYDAATDPLMGILSDRTRTRWGRRRPYLFLGGLGCGAAFALLFHAPALGGGQASVALVFVLLLVYATAYTVFNVPYLAMPAEMSRDYNERSYLMSYRVSFIGIGQLAAGFLGPLLLGVYGGGVLGHQRMSLVLGAIIVVAMWGSFFLTSGAPQTEPTVAKRPAFKEQLSTVLDNRPFTILILTKLALLMGVAFTGSTMAFVTTRILAVPDQFLAALILAITVGQIGSMPMWLRLARGKGKKFVYYGGALLFCLSSLSWLLADAEEAVPVFLVRGLVWGIGSGGLQLITNSLVPDALEYDYLRTGLRREGVLSGVFSTIEKIAFALGTAVTALFLGSMGYISGTEGAQTQQPESAIFAIYLCMSVLPAIAVALSAFVLRWYTLDEHELGALRKRQSPGAGGATQ